MNISRFGRDSRFAGGTSRRRTQLNSEIIPTLAIANFRGLGKERILRAINVPNQ